MVPSDTQVEALKSSIWFPLAIYTDRSRGKSRLEARYFSKCSQSRQAAYDALVAGHALLSQSQSCKRSRPIWWAKSIKPRLSYRVLKSTKRAALAEWTWFGEDCANWQSNKNADADKKAAYTNELTKAEGVLNRIDRHTEYRSIKLLPAWQQTRQL